MLPIFSSKNSSQLNFNSLTLVKKISEIEKHDHSHDHTQI